MKNLIENKIKENPDLIILDLKPLNFVGEFPNPLQTYLPKISGKQEYDLHGNPIHPQVNISVFLCVPTGIEPPNEVPLFGYFDSNALNEDGNVVIFILAEKVGCEPVNEKTTPAYLYSNTYPFSEVLKNPTEIQVNIDGDENLSSCVYMEMPSPDLKQPYPGNCDFQANSITDQQYPSELPIVGAKQLDDNIIVVDIALFDIIRDKNSLTMPCHQPMRILTGTNEDGTTYTYLPVLLTGKVVAPMGWNEVYNTFKTSFFYHKSAEEVIDRVFVYYCISKDDVPDNFTLVTDDEKGFNPKTARRLFLSFLFGEGGTLPPPGPRGTLTIVSKPA